VIICFICKKVVSLPQTNNDYGTRSGLSTGMKYGLSDTVIEELKGVFRRHPNIQKVLIFGSRSKGNYRVGSDIDLAVIGKDLDYNQLLDILCEIDDLELFYSVDLLDYQKKKGTPIGDHIDRVGQVFYEVA
jgi:predicted nucleotidyltransferase